MRYLIEVRYQKNIGSKLDNDCTSSERKSGEETRMSNYH